jgi:CRP-like cAMP-binding protein
MSGEIAELCAELTRLSSSVRMPKGAVLFRCGDRVSGIFIIHRGVVRMSLDGADSVFPARKLGPGEIVGLPATLTGNYSLSAEVTEDAELGFVPAQRITDMPRCAMASRTCRKTENGCSLPRKRYSTSMSPGSTAPASPRTRSVKAAAFIGSSGPM